MSFTCRWIEDKRIVCTSVLGDLSSQEALEIAAAHGTFLDAGKAPIHFILDLGRMGAIPVNLRQNVSIGEVLRHPSLGWTVVVGGTVLVNFTMTVFRELFHMRYANRTTVEAALEFLAEQDQSLPRSWPGWAT